MFLVILCYFMLSLFCNSFIGSKQECDHQEEIIIQYSVNESLKDKKNRTQAPKVIQHASEQIRDENKASLYESEIAILKQKLKESDEKLKESEDKLKQSENAKSNLESLLATKKTTNSTDKII